jgi:hypothetical protein
VSGGVGRNRMLLAAAGLVNRLCHLSRAPRVSGLGSVRA